MTVTIKLKRKYRSNIGAVMAANGIRYGDYYGPKHGISGDHGRRRKRNKTGPKTYDKTRHILYILRSGKWRMVHQ